MCGNSVYSQYKIVFLNQNIHFLTFLFINLFILFNLNLIICLFFLFFYKFTKPKIWLQLISMAKVIHFVCSNWSMKDYELEQSIRLYHQNGTKCFHCKCLFIYVFIELSYLFLYYCIATSMIYTKLLR